MRILKTKHFAKWAIKNKISDSSLFSAAKEIKDGAFDANYGGGVIKKRIATKGRGKSGSVRTIVAFKLGLNCFFIYGFEKSAKSNISTNEEKAMKLVAKSLLAYLDDEIDAYLKEGVLIEVNDEQE